MRKITFLFLLVIFTMSFPGFASAEPGNINDALATANQELRAKNDGADYFRTINKNNKNINEQLWVRSKLFSYGSPQEASTGANDFDPGTNQYRYHGFTRNGEKYTNTFFRNDSTNTININTSNWVRYPWLNTKVQKFVHDTLKEPLLEDKNPFNNNPDYLKSMLYGMDNLKLYNTNMKFSMDGKQWQEYVHILQPPTQFSFGMGRMFRQDASGNIVGYLTIPLTPFSFVSAIPDLAVEIEVDRFRNVKPGDKVTFKVRYSLNKDHYQAERAWLRLHHVVNNIEYPITLVPVNPVDALDSNGYTSFAPGEVKEYSGTFTVSDKPSKIVARNNPIDTDQDKNWSNNRDEAPVTMQNLRVEIISKPDSAQPGEPVSVGARIFNEMADMQVTRLVAKINGKVVYDIANFDVISMADKAVNFKMPDSDATVEFYINPDRDKPADEITYADNIAKCTIKKLAPIIDNDGNLKVTIIAPSRVQPLKDWTFTVKVEGRFPPPPPPPSKDDESTATISLKVNGKAINTLKYHLSEGTWGDVVIDERKQVDYQKSTGITVPRGKKFSKTVTFTFPRTSGFPGQDYPINLHAKATWRNYNGEDTSKTMIFLKITERETAITK